MSQVRKKYSKSLKFQAALAMIKGEKTAAEIASEFKVLYGFINIWHSSSDLEFLQQSPNEKCAQSLAQQLLHIQRCHAALTGSCDGLAIDFVLNVAGCKNAGDVGESGPRLR